MCGLFATINYNLQNKTIEKILKNLEHRGPDSNGQFISTEKYTVNFLHTRLEILDLKMGAQPMFSNDKNYIFYFPSLFVKF